MVQMNGNGHGRGGLWYKIHSRFNGSDQTSTLFVMSTKLGYLAQRNASQFERGDKGGESLHDTSL